MDSVAGCKGTRVICWAVAAVLGLATGRANAGEAATNSAADIDQAVISKLSTSSERTPAILAHLDLTEAFDTRSRWALVVAKEPDAPDSDGLEPGAVSVCFVRNGLPDCSEEIVLAKYREQRLALPEGERPFYALLASEVVHSGPRRTRPLLLLKTCTMPGGNGNCGVSTILFDYDRKADRFRPVLFIVTGRNNNEEARFVEIGPLLGAVIVAVPTGDAPFRYFVDVYRRSPAGRYERVLHYRGRTGYGDGNRLAVIDSEMPEILRRLGLWTAGDALPVPPTMPAGCSRLVMRRGVEWCE